MVYRLAQDAPARYQWEANSAPSQSWNCGPTCVTRIACYYRDTWLGIEATRKLVASPMTATNAWQQAEMLRKRGVPCSAREINSLDEAHGLVGGGRRPILIGVQMLRVPASVRGHNFLGWHAIVLVVSVVRGGLRGFLVNDPNFNPPGVAYGTDPARGLRFYSDAVLQGAWIANSPRYCVVPNAPKVVAAPSPPPPSVATMEAWQVPLRYRPVSGTAVIKNGKGFRTKASTSQPFVGIFHANTPLRLIGRFDDQPSTFDPWYLVDWYRGNGHGQGIITKYDCVSVKEI